MFAIAIALTLLIAAAATAYLVLHRHGRTRPMTREHGDTSLTPPPGAPVVELATIATPPVRFRDANGNPQVFVTPRLIENEPVQPLDQPTSTSVDTDSSRQSPFAAPLVKASRISLPDDGAHIDLLGRQGN